MSETREERVIVLLKDLTKPIELFPCPQCEGEDGTCGCWGRL